MQYKSFHNQLSKSGFPSFVRLVLSRLLNELACEVLRFSSHSPFARFDSIRIQDGTSFAVKPTLAKTFPGRFTTISPAAVELHVDLDLMSETANRVVLSADSAPERQFLPEAKELAATGWSTQDCYLGRQIILVYAILGEDRAISNKDGIFSNTVYRQGACWVIGLFHRP